MGSGGWVDIDDLLQRANAHGMLISEEDLRRVVATNAKQRYTIDDTVRRIRANQGHSLDIDLGVEAIPPPVQLFHGTALVNLDAILASGIRRMQRQYVHL
jgi:putative RNA 2'-phosphotransferase